MKRLQIINAVIVGNLSVLLYFSDNTQQTIDIGDYIQKHPHPQYNRYIEPKYFKKFSIEYGNIVWGKNWDMVFPIEQLHRGVVA